MQTRAIRERVVAQLRNVAAELAAAVADGLGMTSLPEPLPKALKRTPKPEVTSSPTLSLFARPGTEGIKTRRIAVLVADGVDGAWALSLHQALLDEGAVPRFVGTKLGQVQSATGAPLDVEISLETAPSVLWDALIIPTGDGAAALLAKNGHVLEFLKDQYRHCKPILLVGAAKTLLAAAGIPDEEDPGLLRAQDKKTGLPAFIEALTAHRHFERETDPPRV